MISRIKNNFTELMESLVNKKDEILKQNKIINLDNLLSFYEENKKTIANLSFTIASYYILLKILLIYFTIKMF